MHIIVRISILSTHLKHDVEIKLGPAVESRLKTHEPLKASYWYKNNFLLANPEKFQSR